MWAPGIDRCVDITKGIGLPGGRIQRALFGTYRRARLRESSQRSLASSPSGAWLRIVVPDLELYARRYVVSLDSDENQMPYACAEISG